MNTVRQQITESYRQKGSKFIGYLFPAPAVDAFEDTLAEIKSEYPDATHHCYAYRMDPTDLREFAQDDGEPGGTAGLPILNQLKSFEIVNAGLVVVRYYGGTNLGTSGLIEAYGHTAKSCIEKAELRTIIPTTNIELTYPYNRQNEIDQMKSTFDLTELESKYMADVTLTVACPLSQAKQLLEYLDSIEHLNIQYQNMGKDFIIR